MGQENKCCEQEENLRIHFEWKSARERLSDEGDYEPVALVCTICGRIVKEL